MSQQLRMVQYLDTICAKITDARLLREYAIRETDALNASWANALFNGADADSWPIRNLGEVAEIQAGVTLGRTLTGRTIRRPYLRVANVQDGHLDLTTVKEVEIGFEEMEKWRLLSGDVLLTEGGDWDKLGRGTVWREEIPDCIHQNHIFRVRVDNSVLLPEFLSLQTASPYGRRYFHCASKQTTNLASINQRQLRAFPVKLPPIETQAKHLDRISRLRPLLTSSHLQQAAVMSELHAMQSAILNDVFCGVD
jgi:type I restriction enzyme S subunit